MLTPTAGPSGGAYVFTMSLIVARRIRRLVADVGDFGLPPELAAGYPATSYDEKMYAILAREGASISGHALYEISMVDGKVGRVVDSSARGDPRRRPVDRRRVRRRRRRHRHMLELLPCR